MPKTDPRNDPPYAIEKFLRKWRDAIGKAENPNRRYWEGRRAYYDLERAKCLKRVRVEEADPELGLSGTEHYAAEHFIPLICAELHRYKRDLNQDRSLIEFSRDQSEWLERFTNAFSKKADRLAQVDSVYSSDLVSLAKQIRDVDRRMRGRPSRGAKRKDVSDLIEQGSKPGPWCSGA